MWCVSRSRHFYGNDDDEDEDDDDDADDDEDDENYNDGDDDKEDNDGGDEEKTRSNENIPLLWVLWVILHTIATLQYSNIYKYKFAMLFFVFVP